MDVYYKDIGLQFREQKLFHDFSLKISSGEKVWLSASSGKGKSTLLRMVFGFQQPDVGEIILDNNVLSEKNVKAFRAQIGYVSQSAVIPRGRVGEVLKQMCLFNSNRHLAIGIEQVMRRLLDFGLSKDILDKQVDELSGGERQRLLFGFLTLLNRRLWLLDEIISGLDDENSRLVLQAVNNSDATVIVASHNEIWEEIGLKKHIL